MSDNKHDSNQMISTIGIPVTPGNMPTDRTIDVPSIMRAAGFEEGFAAGVAAAAKVVEDAWLEDENFSVPDAIKYIRRDLVKKEPK